MSKQMQTRKFRVRTSEGRVYIVEKYGFSVTCTCKGFGYRNKCKHSEAIKCFPG